jgi:hypothetical protein
MRLSEQIAGTCCGVLADKQEMINRAIELEEMIELHKKIIKDLHKQLMEIDE